MCGLYANTTPFSAKKGLDMGGLGYPWGVSRSPGTRY